MKNQVEDIQNRVRNHLSSIKNLICIVNDLVNADETKKALLFSYINNSKICSVAENDLNWFISLGKALDIKINDCTFEIEKYINEINENEK